eukprot:9328582-Alexandrium_andersonii.AAC.1
MLLHAHGDLQRTYGVYWDAPAVYYITTDASPWGMGGVLQDSSGFVSYWFDALRPEDLERFQGLRGDPAFDTLWEALAVAVSLRVWKTLFTRATPVSASSDNLGALA